MAAHAGNIKIARRRSVAVRNLICRWGSRLLKFRSSGFPVKATPLQLCVHMRKVMSQQWTYGRLSRRHVHGSYLTYTHRQLPFSWRPPILAAADCHLWIDCVSRNVFLQLSRHRRTTRSMYHEQERPRIHRVSSPAASPGRFSCWRNVSDDPDSRFPSMWDVATGTTFESRSHVEAIGTGKGDLALCWRVH